MPVSLASVLWVAAGGALGSVARYLVSVWAVLQFGLVFPWGTLIVNVVGCAAIGMLGGIGLSGDLRLFLITGVLGGFTTFSAFSLETGVLWQRSPWLSVAYVAASLTLGLAAFALCYWLARR